MVFAVAALASAQDVTSLSRAYRLRPSAATRAALERAAKTPLAQLALAATDVNRGLYPAAVELKAVPGQLEDYGAYVRALGLAGTLDAGRAAVEAERVIAARNPVSPLGNLAVVLAARQYVLLGNFARAAALFREHGAALDSAEALLTYAQALESAGDAAGAARQYQRVHFEYPAKPEAATAALRLTGLRETLGAGYPQPAAETVLARARRLADGGQGRRALDELRAAETGLGGTWIAAIKVAEGYAQSTFDRRGALVFWRALSLPKGEPDAERWFQVARTAHRLNNDAVALEAMARLDRDYKRSPWRLEAGVYLADALLVRNDVARYMDLYTSCYEASADDPRAAYCHWKVTWQHYLQDRTVGVKWLAEHVERFPASEQAGAALYFLGRQAEDKKDAAAARAYFDLALERGPQTYYADLARERIAGLGKTQPSTAVVARLKKITFPVATPPDFQPDAATERRIARARLLTEAGLDQWAELEFRFGAKTDAKPGLLAIEWARLANERGQAHVGIRSIKALASGYVNWTMDDAPEEFWKYAYPVPFADQVAGQADKRGVDWQVFAGLIRQESEFDPQAVSRSNARGLAQLMPATGREVGRQLGIKGFETSMLHKPEINLQLGARYLGALFQSLDNRWEMALASYNAGKGRVTQWLKWGDFREPAEFVETIPFKETRNYVKAVLRNSSVYRRLYAAAPVAVGSNK